MPTESAEISPVSTVYLEHVSARIMEISNRILPVAQISQSPENASEHVVSRKPIALSQECPRTVNGSSRTVRRLKTSSDMSVKKQDKNASFHEQKRDEVVPFVQTTLRSNSFPRTLVPLHLKIPFDYAQDAGTIELQPAPDSPSSTTPLIEKVPKADETNLRSENAGGANSTCPTVEAIMGAWAPEEYEEHGSEMERGYGNNLMDETHDPEDYITDEDQTPTQPSGRDETAEDAREDDVGLRVLGDETDDLTADMQSCEGSQLEGLKCSVTELEHPEEHSHDSTASPEASLATPSSANEESFQADTGDEQGQVSMSSEHKNASQAEQAPANADAGVRIATNSQQPEPLLIDVPQLDITAPPALPSAEGNLIDLLSDPIPIGLSPILCAIGPTRTWLSAPRDLGSESRGGMIKSPPTTNDSNVLLDGFDISSPLQTMVLQAGEDLACAAPLLELEVSSLGSSSVSSIVVHQGTQTEASLTKNASHRIISNRSLLLPGCHNEMSGSADQEELREVFNNSMESSPLLDVAPARSDPVWSNYPLLQPNGKKFSLNDVFTSTPKKNPPRKPSDRSMNNEEVDDVASNLAGNISLLDVDTELDELSEYHISSRGRSPAHSPSPLRREVHSGKGSPRLQGTPSKPTTTPTRRPDTPTTKLRSTKLNSDSASDLDAATSKWETDDDYLGQEKDDEEEPERPPTQGSNPLENFPTTEELHKMQMQQMQSIIQNWDQAGSSQPLQNENEESQYIPDDSDNLADDEEDGTSHEQDEAAAEYTTTSGSQFSNGAELEDVFADEPETPVPLSRHKQSQKKGNSRLLNLSPPPPWSGFGSLQEVEPQTPFTPLQPKKLFSTPVPAKSQRQEKARGESRSLVLERSPGLRMQEQEVGNRSLPTTFPPFTRLSPTPVLSKSLTLGRHNRNDNFARDKSRSASLFNRPTPLPPSAASNIRPYTPMNQSANGNTSLPSIHPPRISQMSKINSRKSSISISTPLQARNTSVIALSRLKSGGVGTTPAGAQGTPSMSVYYTPASGAGSEVKMGGGGTDLLDMDLSYGLM